MIAKVTRGHKPGQAVRYLFSAGRHNEHEDAHVVVAAAALGVSEGLRPSEAELKELEAAMEAPCSLYGKDVAGGVCWHLALSTKGGADRDLSDSEWAEAAWEAVRRLSFNGSDGHAPCRWVAARHGRSEAGNDHVHVVVNLVREDGKAATTWNDFKLLSGLCADMEKRYGLSVVEGRANKAAMPGLSRAEQEKAQRTGQRDAERIELARVVRAAATVAPSEAEFVRLLRAAGIAARARYDRAGGHRVVGYAVAEEPSDGGVAVFFGGGKLAKDLSLPALRSGWGESKAQREEAVAEWGGEKPERDRPGTAAPHPTYRWAEASARWGRDAPENGGGSVRSGAVRVAGWEEATESVGQVVRQLRDVPAGDVGAWRSVASDVAGLLAVLSRRVEQPLAHASDTLARSAQGPRQGLERRGYAPRGTLKSVAALMAQADLDEEAPTAWRLLFAELLRVLQAVHDAHLARSEAEQAGRIAGQARKALDEARARLGSLEALREHLSDVVEAAQEQADKQKDITRRRRQKGQGGLRPEQFVAVTRRPAPKEPAGPAR